MRIVSFQRAYVVALFSLTSVAMGSDKTGPWNLAELFKEPKWEQTDKCAKPGVKSILYSSISYVGNPVTVFAYYGTPGGTAPEGGWPAVVCVHGGGGTAFDTWVKKWNDHGYAAISMDLEGHYPMGRESTENPGPSRVGVFHDFEKPIKEQWYYHAVAQVILAHSLIRSFPEVNAGKTGITGISWGGTLTGTVIGLDNRFKFAVPVYGCGFLPGSDGHQGNVIKEGKHRETVETYYDGSIYFKNVTIPVLWVNGTNDKHFTLPSTEKSAKAINGPSLRRLELRMGHGHGPGWAPEEIYVFADSVIKGGKKLPSIETPVIEGQTVTAAYTSDFEIAKAELLYTTGNGAHPDRQWNISPARVADGKLTATVPRDATGLILNVTDNQKRMTSSSYMAIGTIAEASVRNE